MTQHTPTPDAQFQIEWSNFVNLMPEFVQYDSKENGALLAEWILEQGVEANTGSLVAAFLALRKANKLVPNPLVEDPEVVAARAEEERRKAEQAVLKKRLEKENDFQRPLTRLSHRVLNEQTDKEIKARKSEDEAKQKMARDLLKKISGTGPPTIYFEKGPNAGRVDWKATEIAREKYNEQHGIPNDDGSPIR